MSDPTNLITGDRCIDCDGLGRYPTGAQCKCCDGTGMVAFGDGEPIIVPSPEVDRTPASSTAVDLPDGPAGPR